MENINIELAHDKQIDHHANGNADGKAKNIDERKNFAPYQITPCDLEVIPEHIRWFQMY